jgi:hypothetical protein
MGGLLAADTLREFMKNRETQPDFVLWPKIVAVIGGNFIQYAASYLNHTILCPPQRSILRLEFNPLSRAELRYAHRDRSTLACTQAYSKTAQPKR